MSGSSSFNPNDGLPYITIRDDLPDKPLIVFVAGFPDNQVSALHPSIPMELSKQFNMVCVCFPGYERGCRSIRPWGYSMDELLTMLDKSITKHSKAGQRVYLLGHDWGSYLSTIYVQKYPGRINKLMLLDVGVASIEHMRIKDIFLICFYQWWFCVAYIVSQIFGHQAGMIVLGLFYLPIFSPLYPTFNERPAIPREDMVVEKCYPYLYFWKNLIGMRKDMELRTPTIPTLFIWGENKRCMFHTQQFLNDLARRPDCKFLGIEDAGHWLAVKFPEIVTVEILQFVTAQ